MPTPEVYEKLLEQHGGSIDRYIFGQQGEGLANWFSKLYRVAKPLFSSGIKALLPHALDIGSKVVEQGAKTAISKIGQGHDTVQRKIKKRRDNLDLS